LYLELKDTSKCVVGEAYGFSSSYVSDCKPCSKISWKFMFYFMICSYSKLEGTKKEFLKHWGEKHIIPTDDSKNIDWDEVVKKEARGIDDADFGEVQMTMGDTVITEKGVTDKKRFYLPKSLVDKLMDILYGLESQRMKHITRIEVLKKFCKLRHKKTDINITSK
jgi:hypothetical protein